MTWCTPSCCNCEVVIKASVEVPDSLQFPSERFRFPSTRCCLAAILLWFYTEIQGPSTILPQLLIHLLSFLMMECRLDSDCLDKISMTLNLYVLEFLAPCSWRIVSTVSHSLSNTVLSWNRPRTRAPISEVEHSVQLSRVKQGSWPQVIQALGYFVSSAVQPWSSMRPTSHQYVRLRKSSEDKWLRRSPSG